MYLCQCFGLSHDDMTDAVENMALKIITAPSMAKALTLVFHETHKLENGIRRPRCAGCIDSIRATIVELGLRPESELKGTREEMDKVWLHCMTCDGNCGIGADFSPLR